MRERYDSPLSQEAIFARLQERTRPWSWLDIRTTENTRFSRRRGARQAQLVWTGTQGRLQVDLTLTAADGGTELEAVWTIPVILGMRPAAFQRLRSEIPILRKWIKDNLLR